MNKIYAWLALYYIVIYVYVKISMENSNEKFTSENNSAKNTGS